MKYGDKNHQLGNAGPDYVIMQLEYESVESGLPTFEISKSPFRLEIKIRLESYFQLEPFLSSLL